MRFPTLFARALFSIAAPAAFVAAPVPAAAAESADFTQVQAHLRAVQSMTATFVQTDGKGRSARGTLQLKRPGRIRFEYSGGDLLLVANGGRLNFIDYQVGQKESWALNKTPLGMLLSVNPILKGNARLQPSGNPRTVVRTAGSWAASLRSFDAVLGVRPDDVVLATKAFSPMGDDPNRQGSSRRWIIRAVEGVDQTGAVTCGGGTNLTCDQSLAEVVLDRIESLRSA